MTEPEWIILATIGGFLLAVTVAVMAVPWLGAPVLLLRALAPAGSGGRAGALCFGRRRPR